MDTSVEKLADDRVRMTVTHSASEVDLAVSAAYSTAARRLKIPGFRPGHAPRPLIDGRVGRDSVLAAALEELVESSYPRALDELRLRPTSQPDTGDLGLLVEGQDYSYSAELDVRPELTLSSIEDLKVTLPPLGTSDEEIDSQLAMLLDRFATLEVVEDRGIEMGDFALISFTGEVDGKTAEDLCVDKYLYEFGRGIMPEGFEEGLIGAAAGSSTTIEITVPEDAANPEYSGRPGVFVVEVHEIKAKRLPAMDDAFAASAGFDTLDDMRADMRRRLEGNKAAGRIRSTERAARDLIAGRLVGEIPQRLIDERRSSMVEEFMESIQKQGYTLEQYVDATGVSEEELQIDLRNEAVSRIREDYAIDALFRSAGLSYTDEELDAEIVEIASIEKLDPAEMRRRLMESGLMQVVRERLISRHAMRYLMDNVEIVEEEPADLIGRLASAEAEKMAAGKGKKSAAKKPTAKTAASAEKKTPAKKASAVNDADAKKE